MTAYGEVLEGRRPLLAAGAGTIGGLVGGLGYLSIAGAVLGVLTILAGLAIAAMIGSITGLTGRARVAEAAALYPQAAVAVAPAKPKIGTPHGTNGAVVAETSLVSTVPAEAGLEVVPIEATATEAELLAAGRFAEYHLAKAKRLLEAGNAKEAAYQAAASLSHGETAEAAAVRKAALALVR